MKWWQIKKRDADLERELRSDLELEEEEQREGGISGEEARYAALRAFGNPSLIREQTRAIWSWNWLESLARDLRFSLRTLGRTPGFTVIAILVMALGIGANVALFTVVRGVLLKPLPFHDPDRLVMLYEAGLHEDDTAGSNWVCRRHVRRVEEAEPQLQQSRARAGYPGRAFRFGRAIAGEAE